MMNGCSILLICDRWQINTKSYEACVWCLPLSFQGQHRKITHTLFFLWSWTRTPFSKQKECPPLSTGYQLKMITVLFVFFNCVERQPFIVRMWQRFLIRKLPVARFLSPLSSSFLNDFVCRLAMRVSARISHSDSRTWIEFLQSTRKNHFQVIFTIKMDVLRTLFRHQHSHVGTSPRKSPVPGHYLQSIIWIFGRNRLETMQQVYFSYSHTMCVTQTHVQVSLAFRLLQWSTFALFLFNRTSTINIETSHLDSHVAHSTRVCVRRLSSCFHRQVFCLVFVRVIGCKER